MVALRTTRLRRRIALGGQSPVAIYFLLFMGGYLSWSAIHNRRDVVTLIESAIVSWNHSDRHPLGAELSGAIEDALDNHDYLSRWAKRWGSRSVARGFGL